MTNQVENAPRRSVGEYLVNGPIPAEDLRHLDFVEAYLDRGIVDTELDVHFMLEHVSVCGAAEWWKGTVAAFEQEFHDQYQRRIVDAVELNSDSVWQAAYAEVEAGRLAPLPDSATNEQVREFLSHGKGRRAQTWAVELLLDMWVVATETGII